MATNKEYNGWKNYQTWNVSLWATNDEGLYKSLVAYAKRNKRATWMGWVRYEGLVDVRTPDGCSYSGTRLCLKELNEMIRRCGTTE
jgi:hypothetical protein